MNAKIPLFAKAVAYGYGCVSRDSRFQQYSPEAQKHSIKKYFDLHLAGRTPDDPIVYMGCAFDADVSGSISVGERPAGRGLLRQLLRGDHLIILNADHTFCSLKDEFACMALFEQRGINLHIIDLDLDTSTPMGKYALHILALHRRVRRSFISERTETALRHKRNRGLPIGGNAPIGWSKRGKKLNSYYRVNESEREYCRRCVEFHKTGGSSNGWQQARKTLGPYRGRTLALRTFHRLMKAVQDGFRLPGGLREAGNPYLYRDPKAKREMLLAQQ